MASWKKVIVSGSAISQLNNDANFISSTGGGILSSSAQIAANISGSFTSTSASIASDIFVLSQLAYDPVVTHICFCRNSEYFGCFGGITAFKPAKSVLYTV